MYINSWLFWASVFQCEHTRLKNYLQFLCSCHCESMSYLWQGECQWVSLEFPQSVKVSELKVQFQGGFSAKTCRLEGKTQRWLFPSISLITNGFLMLLSATHLFSFSCFPLQTRCRSVKRSVIFPLRFSAGCPKDGDFTVISHFYPEDNNSLQISFSLSLQDLTEI